MPYSKNSDLPDSVRNVLPRKAQTIFRKAFNNAYTQYKDEITVFKVAWSAVKKQYTKVNNKWVEK